MTIDQSDSNVHWNYYLALEADLARVARFVEPAPGNYATYSVELARLLLSSASEVDVLLKLICNHVDPDSEATTINKYREVIRPRLDFLERAIVSVPRYGLELTPWNDWTEGRTPDWWVAHNKVKHTRDEHFSMGNLQNSLNALGALLLCVLVYYGTSSPAIELVPIPSLLVPSKDVAHIHHTLDGRTIAHFKQVPWVHG